MAIIQKECKVLTTVSGKGGVGKSTVACGIGVSLANRGLRTLLIDADEGLRCLDLMLGTSENIVFDLFDIMEERCEIEQALVPVNGIRNLYMLAAPLKCGSIDGRLDKVIEQLRSRFDRIIVDASAGIGPDFDCVVASVDEILTVVGCDPVSIRDARRVCEILHEKNLESRKMIINKYDYKAYKKSIMPHIDNIIDSTALRLSGIVPYDSKAALFAVTGHPINKGHAFRAFKRIAARLEGENVKLPKLRKI